MYIVRETWLTRDAPLFNDRATDLSKYSNYSTYHEETIGRRCYCEITTVTRPKHYRNMTTYVDNILCITSKQNTQITNIQIQPAYSNNHPLEVWGVFQARTQLGMMGSKGQRKFNFRTETLPIQSCTLMLIKEVGKLRISISGLWFPVSKFCRLSIMLLFSSDVALFLSALQ